MCVIWSMFEQNGSAIYSIRSNEFPSMLLFNVATIALSLFSSPSLQRSGASLFWLCPWWNPHSRWYPPHPSQLQPNQYPHGFIVLHHEVLKELRISKRSLGDLVIMFWFTSSSYTPKALSTFGCSRAFLPPLPFRCPFKGTNKESLWSLDSLKECTSTYSCGFSLGWGTFSFPWLSLGAGGGFFSGKPTFASIPPLLFDTGREFSLRAKLYSS
jgi:hypothetical protein